MKAVLRVDDAAMARLLARPKMQSLLSALIAGECALQELAACSGMSLSLLSHHLKRLCALELVHCVGQRARAGRSQQLYRAAASSYFIPVEYCPRMPGDLLAQELRETLASAGGVEGVLLLNEAGRLCMRLKTAGRPADQTELWLALRLSSSSAHEFNEELRALFDRWRERQERGGRRYLIHGACVRRRH